MECDGLNVTQKVNLTKAQKVDIPTTVDKLKQAESRLSLRKRCNRFESSLQGSAVGTFETINQCIRHSIVPNNVMRQLSGSPFLLDFELGYGQSMQIVIATLESLSKFADYGLDHFLSDSRWLGPADQKVCHTAAIVKDNLGVYRPVAASFSSTENSQTASRFYESIVRCQKCGPECAHPLRLGYSDLTRLSWTRSCNAQRLHQPHPLVSIDKDAAAALGFKQNVSIDVFHHIKNFNLKLKEFKIPSGPPQAVIHHLHHITLR